ncbi:MAG TPA: hypothetical protein VKT17_07630 [Acidobacteriota bacterium]|nr:hypothetical protein [Acidobacteriota bacterium]
MKTQVLRSAAAAAVLAAALGGLSARAGQADVGISISDGRLSGFYLAVGDHYRVAPRVVVDYRTRFGLLDEELPVVFFLAARAQVAPKAVIDLRMRKQSWFAIALHFGLSPEIFFVPVGLERIGPPYGNAYGYYRKFGRRGDWRQFSPRDKEIVDLVNLRFLSEYHGRPADEIIGLRGRGRSFVGIHNEIGKGKNKPGAVEKGKDPKPAGKPGKPGKPGKNR